MNRFLVLLLINIFCILPLNAAVYQNDSFLVQPDSIHTVDTSEVSQISDTVKSGLLGESGQVIPREQTFDFNLVRLLRGLLGMAVLILIAFSSIEILPRERGQNGIKIYPNDQHVEELDKTTQEVRRSTALLLLGQSW